MRQKRNENNMMQTSKSKHKSGYILFLLFWLVVTAVNITGCSTPSQGTPGGQAPAVVTVWYSLTGQAEQELLNQFNRINEERPEVIVKGVRIPQAEFVEQVWNYQAGGEGPDIVIADRTILGALYEKGALSPVLAQNYNAYKSMEKAFSFNNIQIAAPWLVDVPLYYYRTDTGQQPIRNIDQLASEKLVLAAESFNTALFSPWWLAEGGSLASGESPVLNSAANLSFAQKIQTLYSEQLLSVAANAKQKFRSGEVQYLIAWASDRPVFDQAKIPYENTLNFGTGIRGRLLISRCLGIANSSIKSTPAMEQAIRLVQEELLKVETQAALGKASGLFPTRAAYYDDVERTGLEAQIANALPNAVTYELNSLQWQVLAIQDQAWRNILAGADAESALTTAQQKALEVLRTAK